MTCGFTFGGPSSSLEGSQHRAAGDGVAEGGSGYLAQVAVGALGVLAMSGEFGTGLIRTTRTAVPQRPTLVAAKILALAGTTLLAAEACAFTAFGIGEALLSGQHAGVALDSPGALRSVVGMGLYLSLVALLGLGLGILIRHTGGALTAFFGILFAPSAVVDLLPGSWHNAINYMPANAGSQIFTTRPVSGALSPWTGLGVFAPYSLVTLLCATIHFTPSAISDVTSETVRPRGRLGNAPRRRGVLKGMVHAEEGSPSGVFRGGTPGGGRGSARPPGKGEVRPRSPRRWARVTGYSIGSVLSVAILVLTGICWWIVEDLHHSLTTSDALNQAGIAQSTNGTTNILIMGLDSRYTLDDTPVSPTLLDAMHVGSNSDVGGNNTNTLILMHIPAHGKVTAFSIPRDDWVNSPDFGMIKIKQAYGLEKAKEESLLQQQGITDHETLVTRSRDAAIAETLRSVQAFTGAPIDHFALVNLVSFYDIAQVLGGVPVCLEQPAYDPDFSGVNLPAGYQTLNAIQSVMFVRQRHNLTNGDLDRTHRQQAFLAGVTVKLSQEGVFTDFGKLQSLMNVVRNDVIVDDKLDPLTFVSQAQALTGGNVQFFTLPIQGYALRQGQDVNLVDPAQIQSIVKNAFSDTPAAAATTTRPAPSTTAPAPPVDPASVQVSVQNGTATTGLARKVANHLVVKGFVQATSGGNYPEGSLAATTLTYPPGRQAQAQAVAAALALPSSALQVGSASHGMVLALGADYGSAATFAGASTGSVPSASATAATTPGAIPTTGPQGGPVTEKVNGVPCVD